MAPLLDALAGYFSGSTRARGEQYALAGRVRLDEHASNGSARIEASVLGSGVVYAVLIKQERRDDGLALDIDCTCPYFVDSRLPCKHLWATLWIANGHGLLGDAAPVGKIEVRLSDGSLVSQRGPSPGPLPHPYPHARGPRPAPSPGEQFLSQLTQGLAEFSASPPAPFRYAPGELLYVIEPPRQHAAGLVLATQWRQKTRTGDWSKSKPAPIVASDVDAAPEADRPILGILLGARESHGGYGIGSWELPSASFALSEYAAEQLLPLAARTGRLFIRDGSPSDSLSPVASDDGPAYEFALSVTAADHGYRISGAFIRHDDRVPLEEVRMLFGSAFVLARGRLMPVSLPRFEDTLLIATLAGRTAVDIPGDDAPRLAMALARAGISGAALPEELRFTEIDAAPTPVLRLKSERRWGSKPRLEASVVFDYAGLHAPDDGSATLLDHASRRLVRRRTDAERALTAQLADAGLRASFDRTWRRNVLWVSAASLPRVARQLTSQGWRVEAEGQRWRTAGQIRMSVSSGIDWFDLHATVEFGETSADFGRVLSALRRGETFIRLDDGSLGMLPEDWLQRYGALAAAGTDEGGHLRFRQSQALVLDALLAAQSEHTDVAVDAQFERIRDELTRFDRTPRLEAPASFRGALRPYQQDALGWFQFLRRFGFGGCLADDMGLGKTIMILALLCWRREEFLRTGDGPRASAVVVPRSLVDNWMSEAAVFAPDLRVVDYSSAGRGDHAAAMADTDVLLMTYGTLRNDVVKVKDAAFEYVILDEAQAIKNAASAAAKAARLLHGRHRLALSGTPIENHLGELWSLFEFLNPGLLGSSSFFRRAAGKGAPDPETTALISKALKPFFLRRTKAQVARDLPARTDQTIHCELDKSSRAIYDGLRKHYRDTLLKRIEREGLAKSQMKVLEALLRLRQAACHPGLLDASKAAESSAKFDVLLPRLREVIAESHKAIVFSQFTSLLALLKRHLQEERIAFEYLDGKTRDRAARVARFQNDSDVPLFLVSLKAGGVGLNLTAAEYVFLLDPWWNPAVEAQAIDRAHRIGQTREVFAYRIIAKDTVEEKVLALQHSKRALADAVLAESGAGLRTLTRDDLELLLS